MQIIKAIHTFNFNYHFIVYQYIYAVSTINLNIIQNNGDSMLFQDKQTSLSQRVIQGFLINPFQ